MKMSPVLVVNEIETSVPFWVNKLGFKIDMAFPPSGSIAFAILSKGSFQIMLQTQGSIESDPRAPDMLKRSSVAPERTYFFAEVPRLADYYELFPQSERQIPEHMTNFGMRAMGVRAPSGHLVLLAERQ